MAKTDGHVFARCAMIGFVAGLRSMMAPALVIQDIATHTPHPRRGLKFFAKFATPRGKLISKLNTVGELIGDKLPFIPARTKTPSLIFRMLSGAFAGGALAASRKQSPVLGAIVGAFGAVAGTYGGYHARQWVDKHTRLPDPVIGLAEDGIAMAIGRVALSK